MLRALSTVQIRVTKTLDLGIYTWWGIIVFIVEMLGASTTLLYGANLLYAPYNEPLPADLEHHGLTKVCTSWCSLPCSTG